MNTEYTNLPTCPYCGKEDQDWYDGIDPKNDDSWTVDCARCEREYIVTIDITPTFTTNKVEK